MLFTRDKELFQYNAIAYQVLGIGFVILGGIGIGVGSYVLIIGQINLLILILTLYPFGFFVFGLIFFYIFHLVKKITPSEISVLQLSESEKKWIKDIRPIQILSLFLILGGVMGMGDGIYKYLFFRVEDLFVKILLVLFVLYSFLFSIFGLILYKVCKKIRVVGASLND